MISPYAPSNLSRLTSERLLYVKEQINAILDARGHTAENLPVDESGDTTETPKKRLRGNPEGSRFRASQCRYCQGVRPANKLEFAEGIGEPWHFTFPRGKNASEQAGCGPQGMVSCGVICEPCGWSKKDKGLTGKDELTSEDVESIVENRELWPLWGKQDGLKVSIRASHHEAMVGSIV